MLGNHPVQPTEFRADDTKYVMQLLLAGKSCALIGVGGIGKTRLIRYLASSAVREHYLKEREQYFTFLSLDSHELPYPSALAYYSQMALLLDAQQCRTPANPSLPLATQEVAKQVLFERVDALLATNELQVLVFLFDAFDIAFLEVEPYFFRVLLALRNRAPGRICYVVTSSNVPALLCQSSYQKIVLEAFNELFDGRVRGLKPTERDAQALLDAEMQHSEYQLSQKFQRLLLEITGGHAGLLRSSFAAVVEENIKGKKYESADHLVEYLLRDLSVRNRCEQLWNSLGEREQECLKQMQQGMLLRSSLEMRSSASEVLMALETLVEKGVLIEVQRQRRYCCFSSLFASYIVQHFAVMTPGLHIDASRKIWVDGIMQPRRLTAKEFQLLSFLGKNGGRTCSREETTRAVYDNEYVARQDDARLDALVERTRKHICDDSREPRFLITVRGEGHRLNEYIGQKN